MPSITSRFGKWKIVGAVVALLLVVWVIYHFAASGQSQYRTVAVTRGTITETVSVTGNTTPVQSLELGFQNAGSISAVYKELARR